MSGRRGDAKPKSAHNLSGGGEDEDNERSTSFSTMARHLQQDAKRHKTDKKKGQQNGNVTRLSDMPLVQFLYEQACACMQVSPLYQSAAATRDDGNQDDD